MADEDLNENADEVVRGQANRALAKNANDRSRFTLGRGVVLTDGSSAVRVVGCERIDGGLVVVVETDRTLSRLAFSELCAATPGLTPLIGDAAVSAEPDDPEWAALPQDVRTSALEMARHLRQILSGSPHGNFQRAQSAGRVDPRYDPRAGRSRRELIHDKSVELKAMGWSGAGESTLARKLKLFEDGGVMALVDRRWLNRGDPIAEAGPQVVAAIGNALAERLAKEHLSSRRLITLARVALNQEGLAVDVTDHQLRLLVGELTRGKALHRTARSRATHSNRPNGVYSAIIATRPGQIVQIDATPSNVHAWFPDAGWSPATILTGIDAYTRQILALRVVAGALTSRDTSLLLWNMCQPVARVGGWPRELRRWHGMPVLVAIDSDQTLLPGERAAGPKEHLIGQKVAALPAMTVIDHGSEFDSEHFQSACSRNGIEVVFARPHVATDKGIVESWHDTLDEALTAIPGYKGANPQDHPRSAESDAALTCADLQDMLWTWILTIYHDRPHEGLRDPANPRIRVSPNIAFDRFIEVGGYIEVPNDPYRLISFLSCKPDATIQQDGIRINHHRYNDERVVTLRSRMGAGVGAKTRRVPVYFDRWDMSRVYLLHPFDREWLCIPLATPGGTAVAPFSEAITRAAISDTIHGERPAGTYEIARREVELLAAFSSGVFAERRERRLHALEESRQTALASEIEGWSDEMRDLAFPPQTAPDEVLDGYEGAEQDDAEVFGYGDELDGLAL